MTPRTPAPPHRWKSLGPAPLLPRSRTYRHRHLQVISDLEAGEWHLSVSSLRLGTVSDDDLELVRDDFSMRSAVEQRARSRRVRHLWLPLAS